MDIRCLAWRAAGASQLPNTQLMMQLGHLGQLNPLLGSPQAGLLAPGLVPLSQTGLSNQAGQLGQQAGLLPAGNGLGLGYGGMALGGQGLAGAGGQGLQRHAAAGGPGLAHSQQQQQPQGLGMGMGHAAPQADPSQMYYGMYFGQQ